MKKISGLRKARPKGLTFQIEDDRILMQRAWKTILAETQNKGVGSTAAAGGPIMGDMEAVRPWSTVKYG